MHKQPQSRQKQKHRPVICVADPENRESGGHYIFYFCLHAKTFIECGARVIAITPYADIIRKELSDDGIVEGDTLAILEIKPHPQIKIPRKKGLRKLVRRTGLIWRWWKLSKNVKNAGRQCGMTIDHVFITDLPTFVPFYERRLTCIIDWIFSYKWSAWSYDPSFYRHKNGVYSDETLKKTCPGSVYSKRLNRIFHIDSDLVKAVNRATHPFGTFCYIPDVINTKLPTDIPEWISDLRTRAGSKKIVVLPGVQGSRKGMYDLLSLAEKRMDLFFIFAGPLDPGDHPPDGLDKIHRMEDYLPDNCFFRLQRIPCETTFNALICTADAVWAVYRNHLTSSGVMIKSICFGKPVLIAEDAPMMHALARKYRAGTPVPAGNLQACSDALDRVLSSPNSAPSVRAQHDFSIERFAEVINRFTAELAQTTS